MKYPARTFVFLILTLNCLLTGSCSTWLSKDGGANAGLVIAVWDGPIAQRTKQFTSEYTKSTGFRVSVSAYPEWQFHNLVEARLLAGTSPWDVIYLKGEWVPDLAKDHALADLTPLIGAEQKRKAAISEFSLGEGLYGLPVDGNLPFLFFRKDQIEVDAIDSITSLSGYLEFLSQEHLPAGEFPSGIALGDANVQQILMAYSSYIAHSQLITNPSSAAEKDDFINLLKTICGKGASRIFAPESNRWGEEDLASALREGKIASAILWSDAGAPLLGCTKDGPTCKNGESSIGYQTVPSSDRNRGGDIPRLMNAWTVPGRNARTDAAARWLEWVGSPEGKRIWQNLGGIPLGNETQNIPVTTAGSFKDRVQALFFNAYPAIGTPGSDVLQLKFDSYIHACTNGTMNPEELVEKYSQDVSGFLTQSDPLP